MISSQGIPDSPSQVPIGSLETLNASSQDDEQENLNESLNQDAENPKAPGGTAGKIYSKAWDDYNILYVKGIRKAECKSCKRLILGDPKQGTSHLTNHQKRCPQKKTRDIRQQILQANFSEKLELSPFNFDKDVARKELAKMDITHEYPLMMVEHGGFRSFCNTLNPLFQVASRNTIKSDCMKIYEAKKNVTLQMLEKNDGRVAVTTDMWTSSFQKKGFMVVTTHYIGNNWILQSRIIGTWPPQPSGFPIESLRKYGIRSGAFMEADPQGIIGESPTNGEIHAEKEGICSQPAKNLKGRGLRPMKREKPSSQSISIRCNAHYKGSKILVLRQIL